MYFQDDSAQYKPISQLYIHNIYSTIASIDISLKSVVWNYKTFENH